MLPQAGSEAPGSAEGIFGCCTFDSGRFNNIATSECKLAAFVSGLLENTVFRLMTSSYLMPLFISSETAIITGAVIGAFQNRRCQGASASSAAFASAMASSRFAGRATRLWETLKIPGEPRATLSCFLHFWVLGGVSPYSIHVLRCPGRRALPEAQPRARLSARSQVVGSSASSTKALPT